MGKPLLVLDFDGTLHSYTSGWKGPDCIPDAPVPGALDFIRKALDYFEVAIFSSRSTQAGGLDAMQHWLYDHLLAHTDKPEDASEIFMLIQWPREKPAAFLTIDDRAITFTGEWPSIKSLKNFKPWNKR